MESREERKGKIRGEREEREKRGEMEARRSKERR